jgi:hypothetical protein
MIMLYLIFAICYTLAATAEWPCKSNAQWRSKLRHHRHLLEFVIALTYFALFGMHIYHLLYAVEVA